MNPIEDLTATLRNTRRRRFTLRDLHLDPPLITALLLLAAVGLAVLYSASGQNLAVTLGQAGRIALGFGLMLLIAQLPPHQIERWSLPLYGVGVVLLVAVLVAGEVSMGARRWLGMGMMRFQPSEIMKIAVPMMLAWFLAARPLPPATARVVAAGALILAPAVMIALQPDLGTALLVISSGVFVLLLAGMSWRLVFTLLTAAAASAPVLWHFLHDYQRQRVLTFLNPENDPLGAGYHIIQSKIAIGSGGIFGKGWLNGTQSHLEFIPERSTDFIFAVFAEEFGLIGSVLLLSIYLYIVVRGLYIASQAQTSYNRLLAGSIILTFFVYVFVNVGMVSGLLPVVGVPLPLVSFGGTSMVTLMGAFGVLMSMHTHRKLMPT